MPATAARAQFIRQEFRSVTNGPVTAVETAWGSLARRTSAPIETFFEVEADAQDICDERISLLSASRRRFTQQIQGEATGMGLSYITASPCATVKDSDRLMDGPALVSEIQIDFGKEVTQLELWG